MEKPSGLLQLSIIIVKVSTIEVCPLSGAVFMQASLIEGPGCAPVIAELGQ